MTRSPRRRFPSHLFEVRDQRGTPRFLGGRRTRPHALGAWESMPRFSVSLGHVSGATDMDARSGRPLLPEACPPADARGLPPACAGGSGLRRGGGSSVLAVGLLSEDNRDPANARLALGAEGVLCGHCGTLPAGSVRLPAGRTPRPMHPWKVRSRPPPGAVGLWHPGICLRRLRSPSGSGSCQTAEPAWPPSG